MSQLAETLEDFVHMVAEQLVLTPDEIEVESVESDDEVKLNLYVAAGDVGKVIGKKGMIANSIRTLARAIAFKNADKRHIYFDVVDDNNDAPYWNKELRS